MRLPDHIDPADYEALVAYLASDDFAPDPQDWQDAAPLRRIVDARRGVDDADRALHDAVDAARVAGFSWGTVGLVLGTTRQAARQRFGLVTR